MESYRPIRIATNDAGLYLWLIWRPVRECVTWALANNKGADQTAQMLRLVCGFVVGKPPKTGFLLSRPILCT